MLKHGLISQKAGKPGRKSRKRPTAATGTEAAASTTKRKRQNLATTSTNVDDTAGVSGETGVSSKTVNKERSDNDDSDATSFDPFLDAVTQRISL